MDIWEIIRLISVAFGVWGIVKLMDILGLTSRHYRKKEENE